MHMLRFSQGFLNEQVAKHPADFVRDLVISELSFGGMW